MRDRNGHAVRQVPRVRPGAFREARDLQVASTSIETKPFAFPKAVRPAKALEPWLTLFNPAEVYLGLGRAPATGAVFRALAENPGPLGSFHYFESWEGY